MGLRRSYLAFNAALDSLYADNLLSLADSEEYPAFDDSAFLDAAGMVYRAHGFDASQLATPEARRLIAETLRHLNRAISSSLPHEVPDSVRHALENNAFIFSGFKTFHSLREVGLSLTTDSGDIKPFADFHKDVLKLNNQYNHNYLYAEYNHAIGASLMAARWQQFQADADRYDLQYRTAQDDRVRDDHAILHGTTLPPSDPFWSLYLPPNGWNCRCTAVQVRKGKFPLSDPALSMLRGNNCTENAKQQIFRFNPGQSLQLFPPKHPYFPKGCGDCADNINLAYDPKREKCRVCRLINEQARMEETRRLYERLSKDSKYKDVKYDPVTGGLTASHVGHNSRCNNSEILNWNMTSYQLELELQSLLFKSGHVVIFCDEQKKKGGKFLPALDMQLDGVIMDIRTPKNKKGHYGSQIAEKNSQILKYNNRSDVIVPADTMCLYFHDSSYYRFDRIFYGVKWAQKKCRSLALRHIISAVRIDDETIVLHRYDIQT